MMTLSNITWRQLTRGVFCLAALPPAAAVCQVTRVEGTAPPDSVVLEHTRGGAYFVAEPLKRAYDKLVARARALEADLDAERIGGPEALAELTGLRGKLSDLRAEIGEKRVLVSPAKVHRRAEEATFDLGPEGLLVVTADHVRVVGWDRPGVKCVLDKAVLVPDDKPVDEHLKALMVVHSAGAAGEVGGGSAAARAAAERAFLAGEDGKKLDARQLDGRRRLVAEIATSHAPYAAFQGKEIDTVEVEGLTYEQGNRSLVVDVRSPGGGASTGSDWQRQASLTVYVPPGCKGVAVRGCLGSLDVRGVAAPVLLTRDGSRDRDYEGTFAVRDLAGPLTVRDVPLDVVENVRGDVTVASTTELVNSGTTHDAAAGTRTLYTPPPRALTIRNVGGDLTARFARSDLTVGSVGGRVDVVNEYGNTTWDATAGGTPLATKPHRVTSSAGRVEARLSAKAVGPLPVLALTNCGTVKTDAPQAVLPDLSLGTPPGTAGDANQDWRGLRSASADNSPGSVLDAAGRLGLVVGGGVRPPGVDLVSRGGVVRVVWTD